MINKYDEHLALKSVIEQLLEDEGAVLVFQTILDVMKSWKNMKFTAVEYFCKTLPLEVLDYQQKRALL